MSCFYRSSKLSFDPLNWIIHFRLVSIQFNSKLDPDKKSGWQVSRSNYLMILSKKNLYIFNEQKFKLRKKKSNPQHILQMNILVSNERWSNNYILKKLYDFFIIRVHASKEARSIKTKEKNSIIMEWQLHYLTWFNIYYRYYRWWWVKKNLRTEYYWTGGGLKFL